MAWSIRGRYFENCSCDMPCPCTVSFDAGADSERCNAVLIFHVDTGEVDNVDVSDLMTLAGVPLRSGWVLTICPLLALAVLCWVVVLQRMGGGDGGPGVDPGTLGFFTGMWTVMMAAMMLPSVWPTVLVYRQLQAARRERGKNAVRMGSALLLVG